MIFDKRQQSATKLRIWANRIFTLLVSLGVLVQVATPVMAHHAMDNVTPDNWLTGFLSGLAHPVIGLDHLMFVVALGLIAAGSLAGLAIPASFLVAAMVGTIIHVNNINLPVPEVVIALSVIMTGLFLFKKLQVSPVGLISLAGIAGIFHGYAYGESIVGAGISPLISYLIGFTLIQLAIATGAMKLAEWINEKLAHSNWSGKQVLGLFIFGIGAVYFANAMIA
ncbi:MAG: HupE/UreJ family protein [Microcoleaceae cyanobacterium]